VCPTATGFLPYDIPCLESAGAFGISLSGREDADIAADLWSKVPRPAGGVLVVVTDACFSKATGPFFVHEHALDTFMREHADRVDDSFFGGDVVVLSESENRLIVVHSEVAFSYTAAPDAA
jgi:hypothetical protein